MFKQANGMPYRIFMKRLHSERLFDWYMEIGCRAGRTFAPVRGKTIAVDPFFTIESNVFGVKPKLYIFQETSDDFFKSGFLQTNNIEIFFSFLDGMHLFEFLLRDFMAAERAAHKNGVVALHDCCPFNHIMTTRDLSNLPKGAWTGDVWKLIPILKKYRPDLEVSVLDAAPTGVVLVSNLDPNSKVLDQEYEEIVKYYESQTLETFGLKNFNDLFDFVDSRDFIAAGYPMFSKVTIEERLFVVPKKISP